MSDKIKPAIEDREACCNFSYCKRFDSGCYQLIHVPQDSGTKDASKTLCGAYYRVRCAELEAECEALKVALDSEAALWAEREKFQSERADAAEARLADKAKVLPKGLSADAKAYVRDLAQKHRRSGQTINYPNGIPTVDSDG